MSKRYVLLLSGTDIDEERWEALVKHFEGRYGKVKAIRVKGNDKAMIVKTDNVSAPRMREENGQLMAGTASIETVLTSGSIGKLKRRASEGRMRE
jgi:hypothetical protein